MKRIPIILLILISATFSFSQSDSLDFDKKAKDRSGIWLIPSASKNIYGIAIGPFGSEAICNRPYTKYSHGLNLQILGQGFFQTFYINKLRFKDLQANENPDSLMLRDTLPLRAIHNGLMISPLGTFTNQVNGISFSLWMSMGQKTNGLSFNLLWNFYEQVNGITAGAVNHTAKTHGLQIGLVNKTIKLKGLQIGIWNKNEKRSLPIINWNFNDRKSEVHNRDLQCMQQSARNKKRND
jgi:hypothetical protein